MVIANEKGTLSTAEFIRKEDELRQSLALTEGQTRSIRAALKAETDERKKGAACTRTASYSAEETSRSSKPLAHKKHGKRRPPKNLLLQK